MKYLDLDSPPEALLSQLDKQQSLIPYGGANFGMPLDLLEPGGARLVPNDRFFVRSNGPVPLLEAQSWRLTVSGLVARPLQLSLTDLQALEARAVESFLECAGNGRTFFDPLPSGTPWRHDAIGNAVWEGVPLAAVLALAGVLPDAVDVVSQGGDAPTMRRGLPLALALNPEILVAWAMNGELLPLAHGGPVRLIVPGWAGIASTKWLVGLEIVDRPFDGFWNTDNYVFWDEQGAPLRPIAEMPPKSVIVTPHDHAQVTPGDVTIAGWAWSGYGAVRLVEVSVDGGQHWRPATLHDGTRRSWRRWETTWTATAGTHQVMARAEDERGLRQPFAAPWNARGYQMNGIHSITVAVEA